MPTDWKPETANAAETPGTTGLMRATKAGSLDSMREWVRRGADVNAADDGGKTALMCAAEGDMPDGAARLSLLVAFGAAIDAIDHFGNTAAMRAALAGRWAMVEVLEAMGADMLLGNYYGIIPEDVRRFMLEEQDSDSYEASDSDGYDEGPMPLVIADIPLEAPAPGGDSDTGFCWRAADDVLNQAFDASMPADATGALPLHSLEADEMQEAIICDALSAADAVGLHFASH